MSIKHLTRFAIFGAVGVSVLACTQESIDDSDQTSTGTTEQAMQVSRSQVEAWVLANHARQRHAIVLTERLADGTIVDWVDRKTVPGSDATPPPAPPSNKAAEANRGLVHELHGPQGALPFIRPTFEPFVRGLSRERTVDDYVNALQHRHRGPGPAGNPTAGSGNRLYGGALKSVTNHGVMGYVNNQWSGTDNPSGSDFSFLEVASYCSLSGGGFELVGGIVGRDPQVYGSNIVFGAEYLTSSGGHWITGGGNSGAWHQVSTTTAPGTTLSSVSSVGGAQWEYQVAVQHYGTRWWVWLVNQWLGYVEQSEAPFSTLNSSACTGAWYGEAFDPDHATTHWMSADMGSGLLPLTTFSSNFGSRAYVRMPTYYTTINGGGATLASTVSYMTADLNCYGRQLVTGPNSSWTSTFFFGGPGGNGAGCN